MSWQRINVVGTSGSGKTTLARELARRLDLPYYEMDRMFWKPGWQESTVGTRAARHLAGPRVRADHLACHRAYASARVEKYGALMAAPEYAHVSFVRLTPRAETARFLQSLPGATVRAPA